jgi:hypothetical protein
MFKDLPEELQAKVLVYLQADQFAQAKRLVDAYYKQRTKLMVQTVSLSC